MVEKAARLYTGRMVWIIHLLLEVTDGTTLEGQYTSEPNI